MTRQRQRITGGHLAQRNRGVTSAVEPNTGLASEEAYDSGPPDSYPVGGSSPRVPEPADPGWAPVMEFTAADVFQHSPFGDMLDLLKSLSLSGDSGPNYVRLEWEEDNDGIVAHPPPTLLPQLMI